jgi:predicted amino acid-binding ACT domain protein
MRVHDFGRLKGSKVQISERLAAPLGLNEGSKAFTAMFRYDVEGKTSYEIVLSTFGPENYREICLVTFYMLDSPGACAQIAKFLGERNIDILNSVSLSMISKVCMVWKMTVDLSYYGDSAALREEFDSLKKTRSPKLDKADAMTVEVANVSDRFTKGLVSPGSSVKVRPIRRAHKTPIPITNGEFTVPDEYMRAMDGVKDGAPLMMLADQDSWVLSITPLDPSLSLIAMNLEIPDKPGAIFEVTRFLGDHSVNLLSVSTMVLVYYERMSLSLVADVNGIIDADELKARLTTHLKGLKGDFRLAGFERIGF